jgi:hypothetical protein
MSVAASSTSIVPLGPLIQVTGTTEKAAGDPVRVVRGGVVVRRELFERLNRAGRVTEVSGPAGSGKSVLLRSWIGEAGLVEQVAQVSVQDEDRDPQRFWTSVIDALRTNAAGSGLVRHMTAATDLEGGRWSSGCWLTLVHCGTAWRPWSGLVLSDFAPIPQGA